MGIQRILIDSWAELCAGDVLLKTHSKEEFCSKHGAEMLSIVNTGIGGYSLL